MAQSPKSDRVEDLGLEAGDDDAVQSGFGGGAVFVQGLKFAYPRPVQVSERRGHAVYNVFLFADVITPLRSVVAFVFQFDCLVEVGNGAVFCGSLELWMTIVHSGILRSGSVLLQLS